MPFIAKSAAPCDPDLAADHLVFDEAARGRLTMFTAPPGHLVGEGLLAALQRQGQRVVWVRLGPEDRDPGILLTSLIAAARRWQPNFGGRTVELMRGLPGPVAGWPLVFVRLAEELCDLLSTPSAVVLQRLDHLQQTNSTLKLLCSHLLPPLADHVACIITTSHDLPSAALPPGIVRRSARDLRLSDAAVSQVLQRVAAGLTDERLRQVARLCQGRPAVLAAVLAAWAALGPAAVERAIGRSADAQDFLKLLACAWLTMADLDARQALGLALRLEYSHPDLTTAALGVGSLPLGPWFQKLSDGWLRVRTLWKAPLRSALGAKGLPGHDAIHRAADYLLGVGAAEQAVPLYLQLKDADCMAEAIAGEADRLMDLGQWETMGEWLGQLPDWALKTRPWLVYHQADIAAAQDRVQTAQRYFSAATSLFIARHEPEGACQSLLAESALAAGRMDLTRAQARALAAGAMADGAGLPRYQVWAAWQLASLALGTGKLDDAAANFGRAAEVAARISDPVLLDLTLEAERLTGHLQEVRRRREDHHKACLDLEGTEHAAAERLLAHVATAYERAASLVQAYGWSSTPLALKIPTLQPHASPAPEGRSRWLRMRQIFAGHRRAGPRVTGPAESVAGGAALGLSSAPHAHADHQVSLGRPASADLAPVAPPSQQVPLRTSPAGPGLGQAPSLVAHLLGRFRVALHDAPVDNLPSGRSRALLGYLLTHRDPWPSREMLMEIFWPDAAPPVARNNLNVVVHGLRRAFHTAAEVQVVVFEHGTYRLHPDLRFWVDVDEFDHHVRAGRQLEAAGELAGAIAEYELAASLYQGDFLADDPYEEWPVLTREHLRLTHLETVDRLSHLYFGQSRYAPCAALCQRILERDPCQEDAHRRLMRCYSRQGQLHLALRQYRICADALRAELGIDPAPETTTLYEQIRRRESV
ncbi:MAG TPA: BTAD domain-containing putative transcriptional regulator [Actinomycetes bacterium]|jgi:DNA-binding SARP family transcriptional activator|nr:BTAD domain-containing putative transcriptional regulator [Actinomycetes bacterium]